MSYLSPETYGDKMKTPLEYVVSRYPCSGWRYSGRINKLHARCNKWVSPLYQYIAPTGFPDRTDQWMSDGALVASS
jgi:uncharacterized protein (DUF1800 family)